MGALLHHSIDESARKNADAEAFRCNQEAITYTELVDRANRLASLLIAEGVRPGDRVGIHMNKGLELPIALYGILKAGAAYVPIDPSAPRARIEFILRDCGIRHLVTNASRAKASLALAGTGLACIIGAETGEPPAGTNVFSWQDLDHASHRAPAVQVTSSDLAYIMYTSGSTGVPKGLMHTHDSGLAYARFSARSYDVQPTDRLGNHSPLHFDMSTFEYLTAPYCGATTVIIPEEATMFPVSLAALIESERLTFWYSVPLALIQLLEHGHLERCNLDSLRWVLFGGEQFPPKYLRRLMELWPKARFSNSYGPAEVNQCTYHHLPPGQVLGDDPIPIGRVWDGAEGLVLDPGDQPVAAGDQGELVVHTPTMMQAYWARPDLNAKAFYRSETSDGDQKTYYRTGDLVKEGKDGNLTFLGRKDRQIKIRGYRVELDEVENVLNAFPEVIEAAVIARSGDDGVMLILAAVQLTSDAAIDLTSLRQHASGSLSAYALPSRFEIVSSFPRTGTGKIDRRAVAELFA